MTISSEILPVLVEFQNRLKDIILGGGDINVLLQFLSSIIGESVALIDLKMNRRYQTKSIGQFFSNIKDSEVKYITDKYYCHNIMYSNKMVAQLIINMKKDAEEELEVEEIFLLSLTELPIIILLKQETDKYFIEKNYREQFIHELIFNREYDPGQIERTATLYGWNFSNLTSIIVIVIMMDKNEINEEKLAADCSYMLENEYKEVIYSIISNKAVFIVGEINNEDILSDLIEKISLRLNNSYQEEIMIGIGSKKSGIMMTYQSYDEAIMALKIGRKLSNKNIYCYNDLGVYKLLSSLHNSVLANDFLSTYLQPLIKYDRENSQDLLDTLNSLIENDWDIRTVSEEQYIHYNTVKYRIKKIGDILNLDINNPENKINIALALKLHHLND